MITKLPRWVWVGGWTLTIAAGIMNVVGLLGFEHTPVSHLTATFSKIGIAFTAPHFQHLLWYVSIVGSFLAGAVLSGILIQSVALEISRRYAWALLIETTVIILASVLLGREVTLGIHLLCFACGLQNALVSTYSGAVVRTTHMTGLVTDLGIVLGHAVRGHRLDWRRLVLCCVLISGFVIGGVIGALAFELWGYATLFIAAVVTMCAAVGCIYLDRKYSGLSH